MKKTILFLIFILLFAINGYTINTCNSIKKCLDQHGVVFFDVNITIEERATKQQANNALARKVQEAEKLFPNVKWCNHCLVKTKSGYYGFAKGIVVDEKDNVFNCLGE